ncbi:MAG: DUF4230 domain-containing protein [Clostridium sp.]|nr:DUF4230 domain-containing protein [Clostridium sp.]
MDEEKRKKKLSVLLIVLPAVLILVLGGVLAKRVYSVATAGSEIIKSASGDGSITVQQKTSANAGLVETKRELNVETIEDGLRDMAFLITQEYYFTELLSDKKVNTFFGFEMGITEESYTVSYEGSVTAGIDLARAEVRCDEDTKTVTVILPPVEVKDPMVDPGSVQVYNEKHSIFNTFSETERAEALARLKEDVREKAEKKDIRKKAGDSAERTVKNVVRSIAGPEYSISIERRAE